MARKKARTLSKCSKLMLDELIEAAKEHELQQEWGTGKAVDNAEQAFNATVAKMQERLLYLESALAYHRKMHKAYAPSKCYGPG